MSITTLNDYIQQLETTKKLDANLGALLNSVAKSCQHIARTVSQGALSGILGSADSENIQGEVQKKLDIISNQILLDEQSQTGLLAGMASEEMDEIYPISEEQQKGSYLLLFDPLDGSSNIDVNVSIGTIFSVLKTDKADVTSNDFLQAGHQQVAAGYALYGPQTTLVLTVGHGVVGFTLDRQKGMWYLTTESYEIPADTKEFAINMSNMRHWDDGIYRYIQDCLAGKTGPLGKDYNMRWIASMVADVHRVLTRGGIFAYPWDKRDPNKPGKLRLMYEANPMSFIVEQAGGKSFNGKTRILDIEPEHLHQRVSVILGSRNEIDVIANYCAQNQ